jgi:hypothetical protein
MKEWFITVTAGLTMYGALLFYAENKPWIDGALSRGRMYLKSAYRRARMSFDWWLGGTRGKLQAVKQRFTGVNLALDGGDC